MKRIPLSECELNLPYRIVSLENVQTKAARELEKYGICVGEKITPLVFNYSKSAMLVKVMGINFVVDKNVCSEVMVTDE